MSVVQILKKLIRANSLKKAVVAAAKAQKAQPIRTPPKVGEGKRLLERVGGTGSKAVGPSIPTGKKPLEIRINRARPIRLGGGRSGPKKQARAKGDPEPEEVDDSLIETPYSHLGRRRERADQLRNVDNNPLERYLKTPQEEQEIVRHTREDRANARFDKMIDNYKDLLKGPFKDANRFNQSYLKAIQEIEEEMPGVLTDPMDLKILKKELDPDDSARVDVRQAKSAHMDPNQERGRRGIEHDPEPEEVALKKTLANKRLGRENTPFEMIPAAFGSKRIKARVRDLQQYAGPPVSSRWVASMEERITKAYAEGKTDEWALNQLRYRTSMGDSSLRDLELKTQPKLPAYPGEPTSSVLVQDHGPQVEEDILRAARKDLVGPFQFFKRDYSVDSKGKIVGYGEYMASVRPLVRDSLETMSRLLRSTDSQLTMKQVTSDPKLKKALSASLEDMKKVVVDEHKFMTEKQWEGFFYRQLQANIPASWYFASLERQLLKLTISNWPHQIQSSNVLKRLVQNPAAWKDYDQVKTPLTPSQMENAKRYLGVEDFLKRLRASEKQVPFDSLTPEQRGVLRTEPSGLDILSKVHQTARVRTPVGVEPVTRPVVFDLEGPSKLKDQGKGWTLLNVRDEVKVGEKVKVEETPLSRKARARLINEMLDEPEARLLKDMRKTAVQNQTDRLNKKPYGYSRLDPEEQAALEKQVKEGKIPKAYRMVLEAREAKVRFMTARPTARERANIPPGLEVSLFRKYKVQDFLPPKPKPVGAQLEGEWSDADWAKADAELRRVEAAQLRLADQFGGFGALEKNREFVRLQRLEFEIQRIKRGLRNKTSYDTRPLDLLPLDGEGESKVPNPLKVKKAAKLENLKKARRGGKTLRERIDALEAPISTSTFNWWKDRVDRS